jgi:hypothetical protein
MNMNVNFNNLRIQALNAYTRLVHVLNQNLADSKKDRGVAGEFYDLHVEDIEDHMENLRRFIWAIACCYDPRNEEFIDLSEHCDSVPVFNPEKSKDE